MPLRFPRLREEEAPAKGVNRKLIQKVISKVNKDYKGKRELTTLGNSVFSTPRNYISTGVLPLDCIICFGMGFPVGIVEIFGPEASGKTAILEHTLAESQKRGYYTAIFAQEFSLDYKRVTTMGLKDEELIIGDAETIEDVYDQIKSIVKNIRRKDKNTPIVIGWDSVAATPTRSELAHKAGLEASDMGKAAAQISKLFRRLVGFLYKNTVCLICINQVRSNIGQMYGNKETTFGGKALKFYSWVRLRITRTKPIENSEGHDVGFLCKVVGKKNKVAPPERETIIPIYWSKGIDPVMSIWYYAVENEIFHRKGSMYRFHKQPVTRNTFAKFYKHHQQEIDSELRKSTVMPEDK